MENLVWTDHVTIGNGLHKGSKLVVILWERLDDSIYGEEHHPLYPCRFNAQVIRQNLPNSLRSPRAHSAALVVRFNLLPSNLHCLWFSTLIFLLHHFLDYHLLIKLFADVFHWHSCVIRKGLHCHPCHSRLMTHFNMDIEVQKLIMCLIFQLSLFTTLETMSRDEGAIVVWHWHPLYCMTLAQQGFMRLHVNIAFKTICPYA